jgi:hypothetical protein
VLDQVATRLSLKDKGDETNPNKPHQA